MMTFVASDNTMDTHTAVLDVPTESTAPQAPETPVKTSVCKASGKAFLAGFVFAALFFPFTLRGMGDATNGLVDRFVIPQYQKVADGYKTPLSLKSNAAQTASVDASPVAR